MIIDIFTAILLAIAIYRGYKRGIILAVFSFIAVVIGVAAAMKLSVKVAGYLSRNGMDRRYLSFLSFLIVVVGVIFLVLLLGRLIQRLLEKMLLGWANMLAGIVLYSILYLTVYSVVLFYIERLHLIPPEAFAKSYTYPVIGNLGPWLIDNFGNLIPWFKDMFTELTRFFSDIADKPA